MLQALRTLAREGRRMMAAALAGRPAVNASPPDPDPCDSCGRVMDRQATVAMLPDGRVMHLACLRRILSDLALAESCDG